MLDEDSEIEVYDKELVSVCKSMQEVFLYLLKYIVLCFPGL